jgi:uncharacterized membrane protein
MRYKLIDTLRGLACLGMLVYHFEFVRYFLVDDVNSWLFSEYGLMLGQAVRFTFLGLVGVSTYIIYSRSKNDRRAFISKQVKRFKQVGLAALLITVVSYILVPKGVVWLGILHLIAIALIVLTVTAKLGNKFNLLVGVVIVFFARQILYALAYSGLPEVLQIVVGNPGYNFFSLDYFPIVPWLGVCMIGYGLAPAILKVLDYLPEHEIPVVNTLGKKALAFYLLHWPFIIGFWLIYLYLL